jgi:hypothetical protein
MALVLAVAAAGCGDDSGDAATSLGSTPTTAVPTTLDVDDSGDAGDDDDHDDHDDHDHDHDDHDHDDHDHDDHDHDDEGAGELVAPEGVTEVDGEELRLVVADGVDGVVQVIDLATEEVLASLELPGVAALSGAGRHVIAAVRDADRLEFIDSGTWAVPHGDHFHHYVADPSLTTLGLDLDDPTHVVTHHELTAVFNDGDGSVLVLGDDPTDADDFTVAVVDSGAAHHGVAVAVEEQGAVIVTTPVAGEVLPDGVAVVDLASGEEVQRFGDCPELHGEVSTDSVVAFGCADGVLVLEPHDDHWDVTKVAAPADAGERRIGTLVAGHDTDFLVGNLGQDALVRIDLVDGSAATLPLTTAMSSSVIDPEREVLLVATVDGRVHRIDPRTGDVLESVAAVDAFELPSGYGGVPVPKLLVAGDRAYLTDPAAGAVVELGIADELRIARRLVVGGTPASVAVAGAAVGGSH